MSISGDLAGADARGPSRPRGARDRDDRALFARLRAGDDPDARAQLIERFLPLARTIALRYRGHREPLDDLLQVAAFGLIKAVDRFDAQRDVAFSTYAVPTIVGEIKRHFRDRTWGVRVPRSVQELVLRVDRAAERLSEQRRRAPSVPELAAELEIDEGEVLEALAAGHAHRAVSLEAPHGGDEDALVDVLGTEDPGYEAADDRATLHHLLEELSARERQVLRLRFEEDMTQVEIGAILGVSQMQISRILRGAVAKLRGAASPTAP